MSVKGKTSFFSEGAKSATRNIALVIGDGLYGYNADVRMCGLGDESSYLHIGTSVFYL